MGYTNAGKSTLFNRLSRAAVFAEDQLFATLDPSLRGIDLPRAGRILLADTVGFVAELPTHLVVAFRATLEEIREARLIVHVADISNPNLENHIEEVESILKDLGVADKPTILALNKSDLLPGAVDDPPRGVVHISATERHGLNKLLGEVERLLGVQDPAETAAANV